nr:CHASE2 domain-containing protein [Hymenobacter translucens]
MPIRFDFLNPMEEALSDFEVTDIIFSRLRQETTADTSIVLVNIGVLDRAGIAAQLDRINADGPLVVGIDAFFWNRKDPVGDSLLAAALARTPRLVLVSKIEGSPAGPFDHLRRSHPMFSRPATTGFANLISEGVDKFRTSRSFSPREKLADSTWLAFPLALARFRDPAAVQQLLRRRKEVELINFRGNTDKFYALDVADVFDPNLGVSFKNKIVLMGYMGPDFSKPSWEDKFYTPLNHKYAGKSYPDMFGVVIHANIISMVLHHDYIDELPLWISGLLAVLLCYLNIVFFFFIHDHYPHWYDTITKTVQLVESILLLFVVLIVFHYWRFRIDLTLGLIALLLSSDLLEVYTETGRNLYSKARDKYIYLVKRYKP